MVARIEQHCFRKLFSSLTGETGEMQPFSKCNKCASAHNGAECSVCVHLRASTLCKSTRVDSVLIAATDTIIAAYLNTAESKPFIHTLGEFTSC